MSKACENCNWFAPNSNSGFELNKASFSNEKDQLVRWLRENDLRITEAGWPGKCSHEPTPSDVRSNYCCAHWAVDIWHLNSINDRVFYVQSGRRLEITKSELKWVRAKSRERYRRIKELKAKLREHDELAPANAVRGPG
jgi:hypothetical protein